jgi:zinc transport system substrate-binding protein
VFLSRPAWRWAAGLLLTAGALAGCGGANAALPAGAPTLTVVTAAFPLAQAVSEIAQGKVDVVDLAPAGGNPADLTLTAEQVAQVRSAGVVVEVGGSYQPALTQAAAGRPNVVDLLPALGGTDPDVWLDPVLMQRVTPLIGAAMIKAEPVAATVFKDGEQDFDAELQSVAIDYEGTLTDCPDKTIVTPDDAFTRTAAEYGFTDLVVGASNTPTTAEVASATSAIRAASPHTVFTEPWAANGTVEAAAAAAHVPVRSIDALAGPPPQGWPGGSTYFDLIEQDLSSLGDALQCASPSSQ